MITKNLLTVYEEEDKNVLVLRHVLHDETPTGKLVFKQRFLRGFGVTGLLALGAGTFMPATLHISTGFRPWICITWVLWVFAYCTGMFNS